MTESIQEKLQKAKLINAVKQRQREIGDRRQNFGESCIGYRLHSGEPDIYNTHGGMKPVDAVKKYGQRISPANLIVRCRLFILEGVGSRPQSTRVAYTAAGSQSYATISASLRHDERAVWAHLEPVLRDVMKNCNPSPTILHVMSDGPVTQYRNKKNFYFLSTIPFLSGFRQVTWNFSEKSHGKGAPDGVGGAVKRAADSAVQRGEDVQTPEDFYNLLTERKSDVKFFWVTDEDIRRFDEAVPEVVPPVKGTLAMHQLISTEPGKVMHREISCFCSRPNICQCHNPIMVNLQTASAQASARASAQASAHESTHESSDLNGKFIMVNYEVTDELFRARSSWHTFLAKLYRRILWEGSGENGPEQRESENNLRTGKREIPTSCCPFKTYLRPDPVAGTLDGSMKL
ncbi:hypothetical protein ABVT39_018618 [Epinephelus coioides]